MTRPTPTTYYVDSGDTACSDSGPGTQAEPFCSLQVGINAATTPGDTVLVTGDAYSPVTISNTGTAAAPIRIEGSADTRFEVGASASSTSAPITLSGASYVIVKDFATRTDSARSVSIVKSKHVTIDSFDAGVLNSSNLPGVEITGESSSVTVSRGRFADEYRKAPSIQVDSFNSGVVLTTNGIQNHGTAIAVSGSPGTEVTSNTALDGCGTGLSLTNGSNGSTVENNVVDGYDDCGIPVLSVGVLNVDATSTMATTIGYNVIDPDYGGQPVEAAQFAYEWGGSFFPTAAAFTNATAQGRQDIIADPREYGPIGGFEPIGSTSPVLNSADSDAPGELATDVNGNPRMNDPLAPDTGAGTYNYYDRGAAQAQPSTVDYVSAANVGAVGVDVNSYEWSKTGYTIDFGDGSTPIQAPYGAATHTYSKPGTYQISVSGTSWTSGTPFTDTTSFTTTGIAAGILWQAEWEADGIWRDWEPPNDSPSGSSGIAQASVTGRTNSTVVIAATTVSGAVELDTGFPNGTYQGWTTLSQPGVKATAVSAAGMPNGSLQLIEVTSTGTVKHIIRNSDGSWQASGWGTPAGSTGITQAAVTAMPDGSSQLVAVTTGGVLEHDIRYANGSWQGWRALSQPGVAAKDASIAGMPNGSSQIIEVTSTGALKHDIRNANGSWQASGWGTPAGSTGITQAAITAMPNGSSELVAVTTGGVLKHDIRYANGSWQASGWDTPAQTDLVASAGSASIAGLPDGESVVTEISAN